MPIPTNSRYEQVLSPPSTLMPTPSRSSYLRTPTANSSYSPTIVSGGQQKLNVVTKVAIEGKAKRHQDGASIRMFLKLSVPLDSVTPGSTIPLFPEENVKIHSSQVHLLNHNSVPYNFSSTVSPLLHNAARALNLPPRSQETFHSAFMLDGQSMSGRSYRTENGDSIAPIDIQYTGHILVSNYAISFVLPKVFLSRPRDDSPSDVEGVAPRTPARSRRSISERNLVQFMAAINMWVPFLSKPPRFPFLLSIPTPRCLSNNIKLRIFPPENTSSSFASLSSVEDDNATWDLTSDPHVTRTASTRPSRTNSYSHFADDESSDSSVINTTEGCVIQGTFPSAERIRIRWAKPIKILNIPSDHDGNRRRVGIEDVKGEMVCIVRGQGRSVNNPEVEGILMQVQYQGQCKGIWFPGVATLLGLDMSLRAKGSDISWPKGYPSQWEVSGSDGYTGFNNSKEMPPTISRTPSLGSEGRGVITQTDSTTTHLISKTNPGSSTSSLLRAPLPAHNIPDYSFEVSQPNLPTSSEMLSSISSLPSSSTNPPFASPPSSPIALHINMNEMNPPVKGTFTFNISGTILVSSKTQTTRLNGSSSSTTSDRNVGLDPVALPCFTALAADSESTSIEIRHDVEGAIVEVFRPTGDINRDPQTRKTVLQRGGFTRCGEDGARILVNYIDPKNTPSTNGNARPTSRPRTPSNNIINRASASNIPIPRTPIATRNQRDGPPIIPWVKGTVTAFAPGADMFPTGYAVRLTLQTPSIEDSEWLEFGIASIPKRGLYSDVDENAPPKVHIICASVDGVPVKAEITTAAKGILGATAGAAPFEEIGSKKWLCWGRVYASPSAGRPMVIDYIVKEQDGVYGNKEQKWRESSALDILLPTFFVSVGRLEVYMDVIPGIEITSLRSNFDYHNALPEGNRLLRFSVKEHSQPQLSLIMRRLTTKHSLFLPGLKWYFILTWAILLVAFFSIYGMLLDMRRSRNPNYRQFNSLDHWIEIPTVTATMTVYANSGTRWWFEESPTESLPSSTLSQASIPPTTSMEGTEYVETLVIATIQPSPTAIMETTLMSAPTFSILDTYGLAPIDNLFTFTWSDEHLDALKRALEKVVGTVEAVWNIFRKVYHYPLDPP
ncbi:hypothetical protein CPB84DRAFT_1763256 [Gymnopilus junonius]|uniref:Ig-like domain-containing protein n=1 Tax=Gymnopilus junonius TaxID=109634 RepID=A0A9P5TSR7_GYMJU|nr:hypothetical protein CPB84DRAFT_1763256 [Gymnopilus junonius]